MLCYFSCGGIAKAYSVVVSGVSWLLWRLGSGLFESRCLVARKDFSRFLVRVLGRESYPGEVLAPARWAALVWVPV